VPPENLTRSKCTGEVRIDNCVPVVCGKFQAGRALGSTGRVDKDVDLPKSGDALGKQILKRLSVVDIRRLAKGLSAALFNLGGNGIYLLDVPRSWRHIGSRFSQAVGDGSPNA